MVISLDVQMRRREEGSEACNQNLKTFKTRWESSLQSREWVWDYGDLSLANTSIAQANQAAAMNVQVRDFLSWSISLRSVLLILSSKTLTPYQKPKFLKFRILFLHTGESYRSVTRSFSFFCRKLTVYGALDFGADFFLYFSFSFCVLITPPASPTPTAPLKANRHLGEWSERLLGSIMTTWSSKH